MSEVLSELYIHRYIVDFRTGVHILPVTMDEESRKKMYLFYTLGKIVSFLKLRI